MNEPICLACHPGWKRFYKDHSCYRGEITKEDILLIAKEIVRVSTISNEDAVTLCYTIMNSSALKSEIENNKLKAKIIKLEAIINDSKFKSGGMVNGPTSKDDAPVLISKEEIAGYAIKDFKINEDGSYSGGIFVTDN